MLATSESAILHLSALQATELSRLVDLEARWENLRIYQSVAGGSTSTLKELSQKQKAYEAFFAKLSAYNKGYKPAHVPEQLLNNAPRLGAWCRRMHDLLLRVQLETDAPCPIHLLAKAYRWADRLAERLKIERIERPAPAADFAAAIAELDALSQWCDNVIV